MTRVESFGPPFSCGERRRKVSSTFSKVVRWSRIGSSPSAEGETSPGVSFALFSLRLWHQRKEARENREQTMPTRIRVGFLLLRVVFTHFFL